PQYELTAALNEAMDLLALTLGLTGIIIILAVIGFGIRLARVMFRGTFSYGPWVGVGAWVVVLLVFAHGGWLLNASSAFEKIYKTQGRDIDHLMDALTKLSKLFTLTGVTAAVIIVVSFIGGPLMLYS